MEPAPVAFLVKRFPGLETFVLNELLELRRQGLDLRLLAIVDSGDHGANPEASGIGSEVCFLRSGSWLARLTQMASVGLSHPRGMLRTCPLLIRHLSRARLRHIGEALLLVRHIERLGAVHLHAHFAHPTAAIAFWAHLVGDVPFSFTAHARDLYMTPGAQLVLRCEAASFVVTCTDANARYLEQVVGADPDKVMLCRHGVDRRRFGSVEHQPVAGRVLSVGRLVPKKGFETLIRACAVLRDRRVNYHYRIVGSGPLQDSLASLIESLDLGSLVELVPGRPQSELPAEYAQAEVFALASTVLPDGDRDGIPNVILEAMAVGVPVVATAVSGIPEVVQDNQSGRLVGSDDPVALANALEWILSDSGARARLGQSARAAVAEHMELSSCVRPLTRRLSRQAGARSLEEADR